MTGLFEITHEDINQLKDFQLTDLLHRLLRLEANRFNIAASSVSVALNIDVPDGGEDGLIKWSDGPAYTDYVPNGSIRYFLMFFCCDFASIVCW